MRLILLIILLTSCNSNNNANEVLTNLTNKTHICGCVKFTISQGDLTVGNFVMCTVNDYNEKKELSDVENSVNCNASK